MCSHTNVGWAAGAWWSRSTCPGKHGRFDSGIGLTNAPFRHISTIRAPLGRRCACAPTKALSCARRQRLLEWPSATALEVNVTIPISPSPVQGGAGNERPAYVANGVVGLRVRAMPLAAGLTLLSGYSGQHPQRLIEAIAVAPYPVAGDIQLAGVWLSDATYAVTVIDQPYDFATGEWMSRFEFAAGGCRGRV